MIGQNIFANVGEDKQYNDWMNDILSEGRNYESPFGVNPSVSGQPSAQDISHYYMKSKQRRPFVVEYYKDSKDKNPTSITMYINPERLTIANSKIIGRQVTKGGIFYHHYGAGHSTMSLSGTTGLAGMAGIKQLEEMYYASGTLLRYKNYAPVQIYGSVESFNTIDYNDPLGAIDTIMTSNFSNDMITNAQDSLFKSNQGTGTEKLANDCIAALDIYKTNQMLNRFSNVDLPNIYSQMVELELTSGDIDYRSYYQKLLSSIKNTIPTCGDQIITNIAYELSLNKLYKELPSEEKSKTISNTKKDTIVNVIDFQRRKNDALRNHILALKDFYIREKKIRDQLRSGLINIKDDMTDPWLPRQMIIYFENRAYVGHFDSFQYSRDAKSNLINYEMKYTITKQYEFNNTNDGVEIPVNPTNNFNNSSTPSDSRSPNIGKNTNDANVYIVQNGDTLQSIAKKFYGNSDYWMDIYAHNIDTIQNKDLIITGSKIKIPPYSTSIRYWVVSSGDNLWSIAKRFYGDGMFFNKIVLTNPEIKNPNVIYPKQILKIVL